MINVLAQITYEGTPAGSLPVSLPQTSFAQVEAVANAAVNQVIGLKVGTAEESFPLGDVTAPRYFQVQNMDDTKIVLVDTKTRAADADYCIKLMPGDCAVFPPNAATLFLKASAADCPVHVIAVNT